MARATSLNRLYRSLWMLWFLDRPEDQSLGEARDWYLSRRVENPKEYFQSNLNSARLMFRFIRVFAMVATVVSILLGF